MKYNFYKSFWTILDSGQTYETINVMVDPNFIPEVNGKKRLLPGTVMSYITPGSNIVRPFPRASLLQFQVIQPDLYKFAFFYPNVFLPNDIIYWLVNNEWEERIPRKFTANQPFNKIKILRFVHKPTILSFVLEELYPDETIHLSLNGVHVTVDTENYTGNNYNNINKLLRKLRTSLFEQRSSLSILNEKNVDTLTNNSLILRFENFDSFITSWEFYAIRNEDGSTGATQLQVYVDMGNYYECQILDLSSQQLFLNFTKGTRFGAYPCVVAGINPNYYVFENNEITPIPVLVGGDINSEAISYVDLDVTQQLPKINFRPNRFIR